MTWVFFFQTFHLGSNSTNSTEFWQRLFKFRFSGYEHWRECLVVIAAAGPIKTHPTIVPNAVSWCWWLAIRVDSRCDIRAEHDINLPWSVEGQIYQIQLIYVRPRYCLKSLLRYDIYDLRHNKNIERVDGSDWFTGNFVIVVMPWCAWKHVDFCGATSPTESWSALCQVMKPTWDPVSNSARRVCFWWSIVWTPKSNIESGTSNIKSGIDWDFCGTVNIVVADETLSLVVLSSRKCRSVWCCFLHNCYVCLGDLYALIPINWCTTVASSPFEIVHLGFIFRRLHT